MINGQIKGMTAPNLRLILVASILLLIVLASGIFFAFRQNLLDYSAQVNQDNVAADVSTDEINRLKKLQVELQNDTVAVTRAKKIVSDSTSYQYQNQIINDITTYANAAGISITGFSFSSDLSTGDSTATTLPLTTPGLKSTEATISVKSPVSYQAIMDFIHAIEINLTKMQVTGVSLSKSTSSSKIVVNPISIKVYTR